MTVGEGVPDLCGTQAPMPNQQLEQDLEPARPEHVQIDSRPPDKEEPAHRIGDAAKAHREQQPGADPQTVEITARTGPSPSARPVPQYRLAIARSALSRSAVVSRVGMTSGGCWRSASSTHTHSASAASRPLTTAPPRLPVRWPPRRWMSETWQASPPRWRAAARMTTGVWSSLSSTKTISV